MNFTLTEDQRAIQEMAVAVFSDYCDDETLRSFAESGETRMAPLWKTCIETGLHSLMIPEEIGGSGLNMTDLMVILEAQGASLALVPLYRHQMAASAIYHFGDESLLPIGVTAAEGANVLTIANINEAPLTATVDGAELVLTGELSCVAEVSNSQYALVAAELDDIKRLVVVDLSLTGIARIDGVLTQGESVSDLKFDNVRLKTTDLLSESAMAWLAPRLVAAQASMLIGLCEQQLKRTVEYVTERRQFDRQIATFQSVQMTMADCQISLETLRSTLWQLVYRLDAGMTSEPESYSTAWQACETGHFICHKAQHLHGGFGVDISSPTYLFLYWSRALCLGLGGSSENLEVLGDWLANNNTLGWKYDLAEQE
ncbi:acyl-CoA dehydrogenase [Vibrio sinensis]|uniref:Acyl-CoA dehydrogenase n=1 Tax=Vibrio sinensis TaxID=2302434 RepID=A0A3A6QFR5_9VIBR|nr:acyl-CoA dehydrogenase family protein [Vibrio sinensis]RJX71460.1 acyl-CoA dehydrogenase [Vibrio sinensis]